MRPMNANQQLQDQLRHLEERMQTADGYNEDLAYNMRMLRGEVTNLNQAAISLRKLEERDPRKARVIEMRFFGGLTAEESAQVLEVLQLMRPGGGSVY